MLYMVEFVLKAMVKFEEIGIVYQDLKPQNILVKYENLQGFPCYKLAISDFGGAFCRENDSMKYGDVYTK